MFVVALLVIATTENNVHQLVQTEWGIPAQ